MNLNSVGEIPKLNKILNQLNAYATDEIEFVTTSKGFGLLLIASQLKFHRITLFNPNDYNTLKGKVIIEGIKSSNYRDLSNVENKKKDGTSTPAIDKRYFNILNYNFNNINEVMYTGAPEINAGDRLVVAYVHDLGEEYVNRIQTSSEVLTIQCKNSGASPSGRSRTLLLKRGLQKIKQRDFTTIYKYIRENTRGENNREKETNSDLLNAHTYWRDMVNRYQKRPSIHVRAPEDRDQITDTPEGPFDKEVLLSDFVDGDYKNDYYTAVFHILVGKNETESKSERIDKFKNTLQLATNTFEKTIVTEYNKSSGDFPDHDSALTFDELKNIIEQDVGLNKSVSEMRVIPGNGDQNRNSLMVLENE